VLVLELRLPSEVSKHALAGALRDLAPKFFSFGLSFLVIGRFWMGHHRAFQYVRRYDRGLLWVNLLFLLSVSFLPFPTALLGDYPGARIAVVFYA
jgi:uncharacterized membrane protein